MQELIEKILQADLKAREAEENMLARRRNLEAEIGAERERIKSEYTAAAAAEIKRELDARRRQADNEWYNASIKYKRIGDSLEFSYNANREKWAAEIAQRVLTVSDAENESS